MFLLKKVKASTGRNRQGARGNAVRNARVSYNFPNRSYDSKPRPVSVNTAIGETKPADKSLRCFRRGEVGHIWCHCHLPFQRTLAFGARAQSEPRNVKISSGDSMEAPEDGNAEQIPVRKSIASCPEKTVIT